MAFDTVQELSPVQSESRAERELGEDQSRQAGLSRVMDETKTAGPEAEQTQRRHMVAELAEQREEREDACAEDAIASAESEGMPPRPARPLAEPAPFERRRRLPGMPRLAVLIAAGVALLSGVGAGTVFFVRRRRR